MKLKLEINIFSKIKVQPTNACNINHSLKAVIEVKIKYLSECCVFFLSCNFFEQEKNAILKISSWSFLLKVKVPVIIYGNVFLALYLIISNALFILYLLEEFPCFV